MILTLTFYLLGLHTYVVPSISTLDIINTIYGSPLTRSFLTDLTLPSFLHRLEGYCYCYCSQLLLRRSPSSSPPDLLPLLLLPPPLRRSLHFNLPLGSSLLYNNSSSFPSASSSLSSRHRNHPALAAFYSTFSVRPPSPTLPAMDRIPKFRRKPKAPTIETAVERSSTDTVDSIASAELQAQQQLQQQQPSLKPPPVKPSKRAAIRNFRLRTSGKRARDSSPAELPSSPPPAAVVTFDGIKSRPVTADGDATGNIGGKRPQIPAFLNLSSQG